MCFGQGSCMVRNRAFLNITQLKGAESYYMKTGTISWISKDWKWNPMVFIGFGLEVEKSEMCVLKAPLSLFLYLSLSPLSPLLSPLMVSVLHILVRPRFPLCSFSSVDSQSMFLSHSSMCGASSCFDPELHNLSLWSSPVAGAPGSHPWKLTLWNELSLNQL